jgi:curved DNA-binding protein CbpA
MVAKTLYDVLGVSKTASEDDIKSAFKKLAKIYHPDVSKEDKDEAGRVFKEIASAYSVLSNKLERQTYDQSLRYGGVKRTPQPRYDYTYLGYADTYGWSLRHQKEWNEHHNMMYG